MVSAFFSFLLLAIFFFLHSFLSQKSLDLLLPDKVIPALLKDAFLSPHLLGYSALGLVGCGILLLCMAIVASWLARAINHCCSFIQRKISVLIAVVLVFISCLSINTIFFPNSTAAISRPTAWAFVFCIFPLIAIVSIWYILFLIRNKKVVPLICTLLFALVIFWAALPGTAYWPTIHIDRAWATFNPEHASIDSAKSPHVILIGIDSLRPDYTSIDGYKSITPEIDAFLNKAVVFPETYTPIARTFPAWVSILTGKYPWEIGVPYNLTEIEPSALSNAFPFVFQAAGYRTVFATDEKRFSNIDESFGFQEVIGPVMGVADFLLGSFNDTALTNLFVNGAFGRWFFPFSHANRAAYVTYAPQTFIRLLSSGLPSHPQQPHFISVHLCLPHHPFLWKDMSVSSPDEEDSNVLYRSSIVAADTQFAEIMKILKKKGYLNNAWVVVLSDHGEGLGEPIITQTISNHDKGIQQLGNLVTEEDRGHGTSILSTRQNKVVLAFRRYTEDGWLGGVRKQPAILADILPTVMDAVGISSEYPDNEPLRGVSLLAAIRNHSLLDQRPVFFETGLNPSSMTITNSQISTNDIQAGMALYNINQTNGRLLLKPEAVERENKEKAYGMIQQGKFLGILSPDSAGNRKIAYKNSPDSTLGLYGRPSDLPLDGQDMWQIFLQERGAF